MTIAKALPVRMTCALAALTLGLVSTHAHAQSLFERDWQQASRQNGTLDADAELRRLSMIYVRVPEPRKFAIHDIITIIIDETSRTESSQSLETEKEFDLNGSLSEFPSLRHLLELQLQNGDSTRLPMRVGVSGEHESTNEGDFERTDRFTARVAATVIDVKPNGTLVLEAKKTISNNQGELQTIVLSGMCREEDVSIDNTVASYNMANLNVFQRTEGEVHKAGTKGLIPRVFEAIFNF